MATLTGADYDCLSTSGCVADVSKRQDFVHLPSPRHRYRQDLQAIEVSLLHSIIPKIIECSWPILEDWPVTRIFQEGATPVVVAVLEIAA